MYFVTLFTQNSSSRKYQEGMGHEKEMIPCISLPTNMQEWIALNIASTLA